VDVQAKDRLTGAVILVALVVLLVPALLSGPGPKLPSIAASPSEGAPLRSYTVELGDDSGAHRTAAATAAASAPAAVLAAPTAAAASTSQPLPAPPQAVLFLKPVSAPGLDGQLRRMSTYTKSH